MTATVTVRGARGRHQAAVAAARLGARYPGWDMRAVRVHRGWSVEALPEHEEARW